MFNKSTLSLKKIILPFVILLSFIACKDEVKPIEFEILEIENNYEADIQVAFDLAKENSEIAKTINKHIKSQILKSIPDSKNESSITEVLKSFDDDYITFKNTFSEDITNWELAVETGILLKTETIISLSLSVYSDTGGAHGNDSIQFLNFNPENGALLTQKNLISDKEGFKKLAERFFLDHMKNEGSDISEFFFGKSFQLPENIGFNDEGVILLYNTYEIASYNQGYTEFVIPMETAQEFLNL